MVLVKVSQTHTSITISIMPCCLQNQIFGDETGLCVLEWTSGEATDSDHLAVGCRPSASILSGGE